MQVKWFENSVNSFTEEVVVSLSLPLLEEKILRE